MTLSGTGPLALYSGAIFVAALAGGALPFVRRFERSDLMLAFAAGIMLGAAFFHMLPEAFEDAGWWTLPLVALGYLFLLMLERVVLARFASGHAHVHAPAGMTEAQWHASHAHAPAETGVDPHTMGLAAFIGLTAHTVVDGFALGAASSQRALGALVFVAILAHKVPASFSLSAILRAERYSRARALAMNATFAFMVPVGAAIYVLVRSVVRAGAFTPLALAASAGTFFHIALGDLVPEVWRGGGSRRSIVLAILAGAACMAALRLLGTA